MCDIKKIFLFIAVVTTILLQSCLSANDVDYTDWKKENNEYFLNCQQQKDEDGNPVYEQIVPSWAPATSVLIRWHNDRSLTANNLVPLDNSTVDVKYQVEDIEGNLIQNSYSSTTYGDSIYRSKPSQNIIGFHCALTHMHVGDSVTMIIPASAGYGQQSSGSVKPYSTLVYHVKLKSIPAFEIPVKY